MSDKSMLDVKQLSAYIISNENQRWATRVVPNIKRVLTVTGSGDQALFYKLAGAKIVDTFDITPNAGVIQDIKYNAVKHLDRDEYTRLLVNLYGTADIMSIPQMKRLARFLTKPSRKAIKNNKSTEIFTAGLTVSDYPENIPSDREYLKLRKLLSKRFSFIRSDISDVDMKLRAKYDLINISNIFDTIPDASYQAAVLANLSDHLKVGGRIVYLPQAAQFIYKKIPPINSFNGAKLVYEYTKKHKGTELISFQRVR